jgi:hypothetical protein
MSIDGHGGLTARNPNYQEPTMDPRLLHLTAMTRVDDLRRAAGRHRMTADAAGRATVRPGKPARYGFRLRSLRARAA